MKTSSNTSKKSFTKSTWSWTHNLLFSEIVGDNSYPTKIGAGFTNQNGTISLDIKFTPSKPGRIYLVPKKEG